MKLSTLASHEQETTVEFYQHKFRVWYKPWAITPKIHDIMQDSEKSNKDMTIEVLENIVSRWELEDDKGKMIPVTKEQMESSVSMLILANILSSIFQEIDSGKSTGESLQDGLPQMDNSALAPIGTLGSEQENT